MPRRPVDNASFRHMLRIAGVLAVSLLAIAARPAPKQSSALPRERYLSPLEISVSSDGSVLYVVCQDSDEVRVLYAASGKVLASIPVGHVPAASPYRKTANGFM